MAKACNICGAKVGFISRVDLKDGIICDTCILPFGVDNRNLTFIELTKAVQKAAGISVRDFLAAINGDAAKLEEIRIVLLNGASKHVIESSPESSDMKDCPICKENLNVAARFCAACGHDFFKSDLAKDKATSESTKPCPECSHMMDRAARFCSVCGCDAKKDELDKSLREAIEMDIDESKVYEEKASVAENAESELVDSFSADVPLPIIPSENQYSLGQTVFALWEADGFYYPATIVEVLKNQNHIKVVHMDAETDLVSRENVIELLEAFDTMSFDGNWKNLGVYYSVAITSQDPLTVIYEDDQIEQVELKQLRCEKKDSSGSEPQATNACLAIDATATEHTQQPTETHMFEPKPKSEPELEPEAAKEPELEPEQKPYAEPETGHEPESEPESTQEPELEPEPEQAAKKCVGCGAKIGESQKFCHKCGGNSFEVEELPNAHKDETSLVRMCGDCDAELGENQKFCHKCGSKSSQ